MLLLWEGLHTVSHCLTHTHTHAQEGGTTWMSCQLLRILCRVWDTANITTLRGRHFKLDEIQDESWTSWILWVTCGHQLFLTEIHSLGNGPQWHMSTNPSGSQSKLISEKPYMEVLFPGCDDRSSSADFYEITKDGIVLPLNGWHQIIKGSWYYLRSLLIILLTITIIIIFNWCLRCCYSWRHKSISEVYEVHGVVQQQ